MRIGTIWAVAWALALTAAPGSIVVQNSYWAKPGMEEAVYRHRLHASEVRRDLGLVVGRVLRRDSDSETAPDVVWECEYESLEARRLDTEHLRESSAFDEVMEHMGTLIERFDRAVWRVGDPGDARAPQKEKEEE